MSKIIFSIIYGVSGLIIIGLQTNWIVALGVYLVWWAINLQQTYIGGKKSKVEEDKLAAFLYKKLGVEKEVK